MGLLAKICGCGVRTALDQQREAMRRELSELASQLGVHGSALAELFRLELGEYMRRQRRRMALLIAGGACAALAYVSFWILLCCWLAPLWGCPAVLALLCLLHLLLAVALLLSARRLKPTAFAPDTRRELQNDLQCLKILLQEKKTS